MNGKKLLAQYGLKWNPFSPEVPSEALLATPKIEHFAWRVEQLVQEGGFALAGVPDPFQGGRFSGLLPERLGVELIGGPYLHASLTTNYTQFGEGTLFGKADWDRDWFVRHARLYRPAAILCWSPRARTFFGR